VFTPEVLDPTQVLQWQETLALSEAQQVLVEMLAQRYQVRADAFQKETLTARESLSALLRSGIEDLAVLRPVVQRIGHLHSEWQLAQIETSLRVAAALTDAQREHYGTLARSLPTLPAVTDVMDITEVPAVSAVADPTLPGLPIETPIAATATTETVAAPAPVRPVQTEPRVRRERIGGMPPLDDLLPPGWEEDLIEIRRLGWEEALRAREGLQEEMQILRDGVRFGLTSGGDFRIPRPLQ
jgi:hypothetical protein